MFLYAHGNSVRKEKETLTWYPEYSNYVVVEKAELGITSMMKYLIIDGRLIFIALTGISAYFILISSNSLLYKLLGIIPFLGAVAFSVFERFTVKRLPWLVNLMKLYSGNELIINKTNFTSLSIYIPMIIYVVVLLGIFINLFLIFKNKDKLKIAILIYFLGLVTRLIIGFSPTVFASGERTSLVLYYSFILLIVWIYKIAIINYGEEK